MNKSVYATTPDNVYNKTLWWINIVDGDLATVMAKSFGFDVEVRPESFRSLTEEIDNM